MFFGVSVSESFLKTIILWGLLLLFLWFYWIFLLLVEVRKIKFSSPFHELFKPNPDVGGVGVNIQQSLLFPPVPPRRRLGQVPSWSPC